MAPGANRFSCQPMNALCQIFSASVDTDDGVGKFGAMYIPAI